jgi:predicted RNA-binding protein YlqC (UPF0109 family)
MELKEFTEFLVRSIAKEPDMVKVSQFGGEDESTILEVIVHEDDKGVVVGRGGKMVNSIRTLVQARAYMLGLGKIKINIDSF